MTNNNRPRLSSVLLAGILTHTAACDGEDEIGGSEAGLAADREPTESQIPHDATVLHLIPEHPQDPSPLPLPHGSSAADGPDQQGSTRPELGVCGGVPGSAQSRVLGPNYPNGSTITYRIQDFSGRFSTSFERALYRAAFMTWSNILDVTFQEVSSGADFFIEWRDPDHFSSTNVLAHANSQHISFNRGHTFSDDRSAFDLFSIAAHEVGHTLGFLHVPAQQAIMASSISSQTTKRFVRSDDFYQAISQYNRRTNTGHFRDGITAGNFMGSGNDMVGLVRNSDGNLYMLDVPGSWSPMYESSSYWHPGWGSNWSSIAAADLDGNGQDALLAQRNYDGNLYAYERSSAGNFQLTAANTSAGSNSAWIKMVSGNFDASDAAEEVIAVRDYDDGFYMYKKTGAQLNMVASNTDPGSASDWADMVAGDFDNDGQDEIIAMRRYDNGFHLYEYDGTNKLKRVAWNTSPGSGSGWIALGAGNLDGQAGDELVAVRDLDDGFYVYKYAHGGSGGLQFVTANTDPGPASAWIDLTVGDYDNDGVDEVMAVRDFDSGLYMYEMQGSNLVWVAKNLDAGPASAWRGLTTLESNFGPDRVARVRNFDGNVYWYEYNPGTGKIESFGDR